MRVTRHSISSTSEPGRPQPQTAGPRPLPLRSRWAIQSRRRYRPSVLWRSTSGAETKLLWYLGPRRRRLVPPLRAAAAAGSEPALPDPPAAPGIMRPGALCQSGRFEAPRHLASHAAGRAPAGPAHRRPPGTATGPRKDDAWEGVLTHPRAEDHAPSGRQPPSAALARGLPRRRLTPLQRAGATDDRKLRGARDLRLSPASLLGHEGPEHA